MKLVYVRHNDWYGTLTLSQLKNAFKVRDLKYKCNKIYDDEYEFEFKDEDRERVERAYKVLVNICDLEIK